MRVTHTYVELPVSPQVFEEIKGKLLAAGSGHAVDGDTIDMHGLAVVPEEQAG